MSINILVVMLRSKKKNKKNAESQNLLVPFISFENKMIRTAFIMH